MITTTNSPAAWRPDVQGFPALDTIPDALILLTSTVSGHVEGDEPALRVPYVGDVDADFVSEGQPIDVTDPTLGEVIVRTGKVAKVVKLSNEMNAQPNASRLIMASISRAVTRRANVAYIAQAAPADSTEPPAGLLNIPGITPGGAVGGDLDTLVDAIAGIEEADGEATHIITSPSAWAALSKLKTAVDSNETLLGSGTQSTERTILDLPVLVTSAVPTGQLLVVDRAAIVSAVGDVKVARSSDAFFTQDSLAARVTFRFGANIVDPARIVHMTVA